MHSNRSRLPESSASLLQKTYLVPLGLGQRQSLSHLPVHPACTDMISHLQGRSYARASGLTERGISRSASLTHPSKRRYTYDMESDLRASLSCVIRDQEGTNDKSLRSPATCCLHVLRIASHVVLALCLISLTWIGWPKFWHDEVLCRLHNYVPCIL